MVVLWFVQYIGQDDSNIRLYKIIDISDFDRLMMTSPKKRVWVPAYCIEPGIGTPLILVQQYSYAAVDGTNLLVPIA